MVGAQKHHREVVNGEAAMKQQWKQRSTDLPHHDKHDTLSHTTTSDTTLGATTRLLMTNCNPRPSS